MDRPRQSDSSGAAMEDLWQVAVKGRTLPLSPTALTRVPAPFPSRQAPALLRALPLQLTFPLMQLFLSVPGLEPRERWKMLPPWLPNLFRVSPRALGAVLPLSGLHSALPRSAGLVERQSLRS